MIDSKQKLMISEKLMIKIRLCKKWIEGWEVGTKFRKERVNQGCMYS